ncbi:MAG: septal ring lytic transglycosylase RlpA family protein [Acidobacteria bacterium]|nr:septal ring lytic transglycosylase RlpA family protein [Acidobacteriota bacterium]
MLLILVIVSAVEAPAVVLPSEPAKPLMVWHGVSSWYGEQFHGRTTANGETYDMFAATAAHPFLPLGSLVRLVNPKTGKSRMVRINDRGPVIDGRGIDVSYEVARSLGFEEQGLARLRIELLEVPKNHWREKHKKD